MTAYETGFMIGMQKHAGSSAKLLRYAKRMFGREAKGLSLPQFATKLDDPVVRGMRSMAFKPRGGDTGKTAKSMADFLKRLFRLNRRIGGKPPTKTDYGFNDAMMGMLMESPGKAVSNIRKGIASGY